MYRVLQILEGASVGGVSTVVLNYHRFIDKSRFHFDFALTLENHEQQESLFSGFGAKIYPLPLKSKGIRAYEQALEQILREESYDAIHVHENETCYVALRVAEKNGVKKRIAHAHTSSPYVSVLGEIRRISGCILNYHYATNVIGCGQLAGERVFGKRNMRRKKAGILPNAVDGTRFSFNATVRNEMRVNLGISDRYVIGMIGRLAPEKNCTYALRIVEQFHEKNPDAVFLLVGIGNEEKRICTFIEEHGMKDYVHMMGRRDDIPQLCQALDVLIMPSYHEGFPIVAVEAMASGLPVLLSSSITRELEFGSAVEYLNLGEDQAWLDALQKARVLDSERALRQKEVRDNGFDLRDAVKHLEELYSNEYP